MSKKYIIEGGVHLKGEIQVRGAKNAVTKQMVAALLASGETILENVPEIGDVAITGSILKSLGCECSYQTSSSKLCINTQNIKSHQVPLEYSGVNRIPILMAGPFAP